MTTRQPTNQRGRAVPQLRDVSKLAPKPMTLTERFDGLVKDHNDLVMEINNLEAQVVQRKENRLRIEGQLGLLQNMIKSENNAAPPAPEAESEDKS